MQVRSRQQSNPETLSQSSKRTWDVVKENPLYWKCKPGKGKRGEEWTGQRSRNRFKVIHAKKVRAAKGDRRQEGVRMTEIQHGTHVAATLRGVKVLMPTQHYAVT